MHWKVVSECVGRVNQCFSVFKYLFVDSPAQKLPEQKEKDREWQSWWQRLMPGICLQSYLSLTVLHALRHHMGFRSNVQVNYCFLLNGNEYCCRLLKCRNKIVKGNLLKLAHFKTWGMKLDFKFAVEIEREREGGKCIAVLTVQCFSHCLLSFYSVVFPQSCCLTCSQYLMWWRVFWACNEVEVKSFLQPLSSKLAL